jgi:hypothetical protein
MRTGIICCGLDCARDLVASAQQSFVRGGVGLSASRHPKDGVQKDRRQPSAAHWSAVQASIVAGDRRIAEISSAVSKATEKGEAGRRAAP